MFSLNLTWFKNYVKSGHFYSKFEQLLQEINLIYVILKKSKS